MTNPLSLAAQIDALIAKKIPKKFGGDTKTAKAAYRDRVLTTWEFLQEQGTVDASTVAKKFGMHSDTAREHLKCLVSEGKAVKFMTKGRMWYTVARPTPRRKK
jgi:predicted HTH transcriptional regulator